MREIKRQETEQQGRWGSKREEEEEEEREVESKQRSGNGPNRH